MQSSEGRSHTSLENLEEQLQKKEQQLSEVVKSGLEIIEESKQLKASLEQSRQQVVELQMELDTTKANHQELLQENRCIQNNNLQLLHDLSLSEEKVHRATEKIQQYENMIQSMNMSMEKERENEENEALERR
ncbi:Response regulator receiver [Reticulomyxa filosa]|uniref:Response regulator receiver n=1 Tax=Reticulomyxa filosa TaxID=46433 RepID=X6MNT0_RETFI|nr:Response regulator receiver [Reticulomyxa filosa]|eukprot:ETO14740.1 Response regulator receiver [Reticulomyxa filosa]